MILTLLIIFFSFSASAQHYLPADSGSQVNIVAKIFGINTSGELSGLKGDITFDTANISSSLFDVTVATATIDTDNKIRDNHLRSDDFLDIAKFPEIRIRSLNISKTNKTDEGFYYFNGEITIRDSTKEINFPFKAEKIDDHYFFTAEFTIDRIDFRVGKGSTVLGNKVKVLLNVFAKNN